MAPRRKLTGAQARLFANICHHYIDQAETDCNDTPKSVPVFSALSRAQRLKLVSDVAVGMLCKDEPLPPDTIQHKSAYRAIVEILFVALDVESDMQWDIDDVGEDLLEFDKREKNSRSRAEMAEFDVQQDLIAHRAERNLKKLRKGKDVGEFHVEDSRTNEDVLSSANKNINILNNIFEGGPVSKRERDSIRPLTKGEESAFRWRRLCDAALQEDEGGYHPPFALCNVNFDWRCQKLVKWRQALNFLFDTQLMDYGSPTDEALIIGEVDYRSYADPAQLPRVQALQRHISALKSAYASSWDPTVLAMDARLIFAVCSDEIYGPHYQQSWITVFLNECDARGIDFQDAGENHQARLNIFREIKDDFMDGCEYPFGSSEDTQLEYVQCTWKPSEEGPTALGFAERMCHGPGKIDKDKVFNPLWCMETSNLQCCSKCKTVLYCSRECQVADWKQGHKKVCARLAKERKDKEKISQMAKSM